MCLACQMEGEWLAYLDQLAQQDRERAPAPDVAAAPKPAAKETTPFVCEELPSE